ncbi:MAG TPA: 16S rRNA (guanine(966)-N(2))-methyltransferase RsmD [Acidimicrobiia bacterium]|nr:16S rRNA (guanine(966)-N(2))-methyltransferase RsmD [Acidimicrobiia bacterium]
MRVIAGEAKGRRLTGIRSSAIRPTSDRVREALFSALGAAVPGARVLDLYAGSGALGIEALSRGAAGAVFVDSDREAVAAIRANLALTGTDDRASVVRSPVGSFLAAGRHGPFDLVFLDPPYAQGLPVKDLEALVAGGFLDAGASVVLETRGPDAPPPVEGLEVVSRRRYGDTTLVFLRPPGPEQVPHQEP